MNIIQIRGSYATTVGNGSDKDFTINHNLGTQYPFIQAWLGNTLTRCNVTVIDENSCKVSVKTAPASGQLTVVCTG